MDPPQFITASALIALSLRQRPLKGWRQLPLASAERLVVVAACSGAVAAAYKLGLRRSYKAVVGFIFSYEGAGQYEAWRHQFDKAYGYSREVDGSPIGKVFVSE